MGVDAAREDEPGAGPRETAVHGEHQPAERGRLGLDGQLQP